MHHSSGDDAPSSAVKLHFWSGVCKYAHFNNSKGWFIQNIRSECQFHDKGSMYDRYNDWCIEYRLMPIKKPDFMAKVNYLFEKMGGSTISASDLEKVKEIWSQS